MLHQIEEKGQGDAASLRAVDVGFDMAGCESHRVLLGMNGIDVTPHLMFFNVFVRI